MAYINRHPPQVRSPTRNRARATSPAFGLGAPLSPTPATSPVPKSSRTSLVDSCPTPTDPLQLPTLPTSRSNVPPLANSNAPSPVNLTSPNYESDTATIISFTRSSVIHLSSDNIPPPYHHAHARKSSSPIPAHTKTKISLDTKHTLPKRSSSAHQHAPAKSSTVDVVQTVIHPLTTTAHSTSMA